MSNLKQRKIDLRNPLRRTQPIREENPRKTDSNGNPLAKRVRSGQKKFRTPPPPPPGDGRNHLTPGKLQEKDESKENNDAQITTTSTPQKTEKAGFNINGFNTNALSGILLLAAGLGFLVFQNKQD